jgi:hypothetical protein
VVEKTQYRRGVFRACDACRFLSDQDAKVNRKGTVVAKCLSPTSIHAGKYRREEDTCFGFERGASIDLPEIEKVA